jgi:hypothetical protein
MRDFCRDDATWSQEVCARSPKDTGEIELNPCGTFPIGVMADNTLYWRGLNWTRWGLVQLQGRKGWTWLLGVLARGCKYGEWPVEILSKAF